MKNCVQVTEVQKFRWEQDLEGKFGMPSFSYRLAHLAPFGRFERQRMAYRSVTDNFFLSKGVRRLPSREARWLYSFLVPKAGTFGIFYELPERLRAEFEYTVTEWEGAYQGLTSPSKGAAPRLFHQAEDSLWFLREQFEEQTVKKGGASPNHIIGLCKVFNNLPEGVVKQAFKEKYGQLMGQGATPAPPLPPTPGSYIDPPPKGKERKGKERKEKQDKDGRQKAPTSKMALPGFQFLVDYFHETWEKAKPGLKITWSPVNGSLLKGLMRKQTPDAIARAWEFYLSSPDFFAQKNGQSFGNFVASFDKTQSRMQTDPWNSPEGKQLLESAERGLKPKAGNE